MHQLRHIALNQFAFICSQQRRATYLQYNPRFPLPQPAIVEGLLPILRDESLKGLTGSLQPWRIACTRSLVLPPKRSIRSRPLQHHLIGLSTPAFNQSKAETTFTVIMTDNQGVETEVKNL